MKSDDYEYEDITVIVDHPAGEARLSWKIKGEPLTHHSKLEYWETNIGSHWRGDAADHLSLTNAQSEMVDVEYFV